MLKYKGYIGDVEYDSDGKIFTGEAKGLRAVLTFQGQTAIEIEESFRQAIDLYLKMCEEDGVSPEKPYSGHFNIRISPELHRDIALCAASERKSINDWAIEAFQKVVHSQS
jgi:predicted HicB family RNase H-like nuclease